MSNPKLRSRGRGGEVNRLATPTSTVPGIPKGVGSDGMGVGGGTEEQPDSSGLLETETINRMGVREKPVEEGPPGREAMKVGGGGGTHALLALRLGEKRQAAINTGQKSLTLQLLALGLYIVDAQ